MNNKRSRLRDYGLIVGDLETGKWNAITDVKGVKVGQVTLDFGEGSWVSGEGPVRTGVTVILPHEDNIYQERVRAAVHTLNGYGKAVGFEQIRELGLLESPIALTGTLNVGLVADAMVQYMIKKNPELVSVNVVVGETNDGYLNDAHGRHVHKEHVWQAIEQAKSGAVQEGDVGAGKGSICFGWKGGIGTASRLLPEALGGFTVGALVQANYGSAKDLIVCGKPVGKMLPDPEEKPMNEPEGSIMIVLATDAPMTSRQLQRLCVRAGIGLGRTGSVFGHTSGDFVIAFSTGQKIASQSDSLVEHLPVLNENKEIMGAFFKAVVESVEEAIMNALFMAQTVEGRDKHLVRNLPIDSVIELFVDIKTNP
ncbi:MAG: P1 family peptidase [Anaerolineaceae bacterium]|nr:P1 family peptidase [Anaerolineaceae bacterium]